jgi:hypothetical protein
MELNLERVRHNVRNATTEDLLDRATVFREEMEPSALEVIDGELLARGITIQDIETHLDNRQDALLHADGTVVKCTFCHRPAVRQGWGWHYMLGLVPVFPRTIAWCDVHVSDAK